MKSTTARREETSYFRGYIIVERFGRRPRFAIWRGIFPVTFASTRREAQSIINRFHHQEV